jgi:CBS domain containing-hemolysin-like protein
MGYRVVIILGRMGWVILEAVAIAALCAAAETAATKLTELALEQPKKPVKRKQPAKKKKK